MIFIRLLRILIICVVLGSSGCVTTQAIIPTIQTSYKLTEDGCILQAFIKEDYFSTEKEKVYNTLLSFRKFAPYGTIHYFWWYIKKDIKDRNEWWIKNLHRRVLANYRYYKKTNERLNETPISPIELLRKAILGQ